MKKKAVKERLKIALLLSILTSCASNRLQKTTAGSGKIDLTHFHFQAAEAPEWTGLFNRTSGWFGGDGIFSIPLGESDHHHQADSILFVFSDTMIGEIEDHKLQPGSSMVHNSVAYMTDTIPAKDGIHFFYATGRDGSPRSLFVPRTPHAGEKDYYWLGDGFENHALNNNVYIFAYRMRNVGKGDWGFRQVGNALIVLKPGSKPPFEDQRQIETPFLIGGSDEVENGSLGAGILVNTKPAGAPHPDGYVYVYGVQGKKKNLIVARVRPKDFERFERWRFWDGRRWTRDMHRAAAVTDRVSNELSVSPLADGRYALIFQVDGMSPFVGLRLGAGPQGPFGPVIKIWHGKEPQHKNYFTYNAKAHPALSRPGELLISYNVNAFDFMHEIRANPHLYRPRFIRLKIK